METPKVKPDRKIQCQDMDNTSENPKSRYVDSEGKIQSRQDMEVTSARPIAE